MDIAKLIEKTMTPCW